MDLDGRFNFLKQLIHFSICHCNRRYQEDQIKEEDVKQICSTRNISSEYSIAGMLLSFFDNVNLTHHRELIR